MGGFERGDDAFGAAQMERRFEGFGVIAGDVFGAMLVMKECVFGSHRCIVETGGDGVGERDLSVFVLQEIAAGAVQNSGGSSAEAGGMLAERRSAASGFDADELDGGIGNESVEDAD